MCVPLLLRAQLVHMHVELSVQSTRIFAFFPVPKLTEAEVHPVAT